MTASSAMTTCESQRELVQEMLRDIGEGTYQSPDVQCGWVQPARSGPRQKAEVWLIDG